MTVRRQFWQFWQFCRPGPTASASTA